MSADANKELVRRFYREAIVERDSSACERLLSVDFVHNGETRGRAGHARAVGTDGETSAPTSRPGRRPAAVVTGANSGLGLAARAGAGCGRRRRWCWPAATLEKGERPAVDLDPRRACRDASAARRSTASSDLSSLASVRDFAERFGAEHGGLDLLINNAGVMAPPRRETADGFELQLGTNHLGHFALTGLLLGAMQGREDARVVTVSSTAHKFGRITFDNLQGERRYFRWRAYGQSKLANVLFARELDKRLRAAGSSVKSLAAHPGYVVDQPAVGGTAAARPHA